jgi:5,10-methylene-tetrahydrofolate dehydrogenase/methenyl tetrahydrofolate cyclohydrolase
MDPKRIDGRSLADSIEAEVKEGVKQLQDKYGIAPGLAVVLVGERKDSQTYVRKKKEAAEAAGMQFTLRELPEKITQEELLKEVRQLNDNKLVHGLIVQLPLPSHINEKEILDAVSYEKDIDGFHPLNMGALCMKGREPASAPCTPQACMEILTRRGVDLDGKHVVVIGRSNIVGIPVAMLALHANATVTICHSRTENLPQVVKTGDVVIAAVGRAEMVKGDWIKPGAVVIDVGINSVTDTSRKTGYRLVGDVDYQSAKEVASAITPVPGGVGPMTVGLLLRNTLRTATRLLANNN